MNKKMIGTGVLSLVSLAMLSGYTPVQGKTDMDSNTHTHQVEHHQNHGQHVREYASHHKGKKAHHHGSAVRNYNKLYKSGVVPADIEPAMDPTYQPGEEVVITEGHMPGMMGALAEIVGAFDTYAYSVTYYPTDGGEPVYDHKWVVQEEIQDAGKEPLAVGTEVILEADHMPGMEGATAVIESVEDTTVYVIDYYPTDGGDVVRNHKWVTDHELAPVDTEVGMGMDMDMEE